MLLGNHIKSHKICIVRSCTNTFKSAAFAPMNASNEFDMNRRVSRNEPFDISRYISESEGE